MNSNKNWVLQIDPAVYKFLSRISHKETARLLTIIQDLPEDPFAGDIQKMKGENNIWRRRVGSFRIRYELIVEERVIHIFLVERRTSSSY